jgi:hypothetical protein
MPELPAVTMRTAAARIRRAVADVREDLADNDYWACDNPDVTEAEVYASGVECGLGGEAGDFAGMWTPDAAVSVADWLDATAAKAEELRALLGVWSAPVGDPVWDAAVATARALRGDDDA